MYTETPDGKLVNLNALECILVKPAADSNESFEVAGIGPRFSYRLFVGTQKDCNDRFESLKRIVAPKEEDVLAKHSITSSKK